MSTTPPPYVRQATFTSFHTEPAPTVGQDLEAELNAIKTSQDATQARLAEIQRDDGRLRNQIVTPDSLSQAVRSMLTIRNGEIRGDWVTATVYDTNDTVEAPDGGTYIAVSEHVSSGNFSNDYAAGKWLALQLRINGIVSADDAGLKGDGTDETASIEGLMAASVGKAILLGANKTYGIAPTGITMPAGTSIISNGSKFKKLSASSTYGVTVGASCNIDRLQLEIAGGASDAGLQIAGSNTRMGPILVSSLTPDSGSAAAVNGVFINNGASVLTGLDIGPITVTGHARPLRVKLVNGIRVGRFTTDNYRTGAYVIDVKNGIFDGAHISGLSPSSAGGAGDNGLLIEATTDFATENLTFRGWHVQDSGEHAFRIGGDRPVRNMWYFGCSSENTGCLPADASTGGAAFKVLHGNTQPTFHENINVIGFTAIDCSNSAAGLNNMAAFQIGKVKGGQFSNVTIRKRNNTYSCKFGFQVFASDDIEINDPNITDCMRHAFQFIQATVVVPAYPITMKRVHINGGHAQCMETANNSACARFTVDDGTFTDVSIKGTTLSGGGAAVLHDAPTGAGAYTDCEVECTYRDPLNVAGGPPFVNPNTILVNARSKFYGSFNTNALDGSTFQDPTTGLLRTRKGGTWYEQGARFGTWAPTFTPVTNVDAATVNGTWRWVRDGDIVQFSGSVNIDNTAASALSELGASLPAGITSNFTHFSDAGGTAVASTPNSLCGTVQADTANDRLAIRWQAGSTTDNRAWFVTGSFQVK